MYDYLIVGAGIFGAVCACELKKAGKQVLVIDKRDHIAGNIHTEEIEGINVHKYGAHIFHTRNRRVWDYVNHYAEFNRYTNSPIANYKGELYSLPFNMYTFNRMWGVITPDEAKVKLDAARQEAILHLICEKKGISPEDFVPENLEEQALSLVGSEIYEKLIKGYTQKQWGRPCDRLPADIIRRLPFRLTYNNDYFNALYQGIPIGGFTRMVSRMLDGIDVRLNTDYLDPAVREDLDNRAGYVIYSGAIDAFYGYRYGNLEYRSLRFEEELLDTPNFQGNAVVNYTDAETPYTRIVEHKWFEFGLDANGNSIPVTYISREYPQEWKPGTEAYYPIGDAHNLELYEKYRALANAEKRVCIGGRLGEYRYYDMDAVIERALDTVSALTGR